MKNSVCPKTKVIRKPNLSEYFTECAEVWIEHTT